MARLRFRYQTIEFGDEDIHVRSLRDLQEFADADGAAEALGISSARWSLFGVLWDAGYVLAHLMARYDVGERSVLEIGSGLALASLVLNRRGVDVTASDRHPEAGAFLAVNTELNDDAPIPFHRVSWVDDDTDLERFDMIIASDVLYEDHHAADLARFMLEHAAPDCEIIVVDGGRKQRRSLDARLADAGFVHDELEIRDGDFPGERFRGRTHRYRRGAMVPDAGPT